MSALTSDVTGRQLPFGYGPWRRGNCGRALTVKPSDEVVTNAIQRDGFYLVGRSSARPTPFDTNDLLSDHTSYLIAANRKLVRENAKHAVLCQSLAQDMQVMLQQSLELLAKSARQMKGARSSAISAPARDQRPAPLSGQLAEPARNRSPRRGGSGQPEET